MSADASTDSMGLNPIYPTPHMSVESMGSNPICPPQQPHPSYPNPQIHTKPCNIEQHNDDKHIAVHHTYITGHIKFIIASSYDSTTIGQPGIVSSYTCDRYDYDLGLDEIKVRKWTSPLRLALPLVVSGAPVVHVEDGVGVVVRGGRQSCWRIRRRGAWRDVGWRGPAPWQGGGLWRRRLLAQLQAAPAPRGPASMPPHLAAAAAAVGVRLHGGQRPA